MSSLGATNCGPCTLKLLKARALLPKLSTWFGSCRLKIGRVCPRAQMSREFPYLTNNANSIHN